MRGVIKIGAAALAFIPMLLLVLLRGELPKPIFIGCAIFDFPALSIFTLIKTYHLGGLPEFLYLIICLMVWSLFIAWVFWKIAGTFLGEDEPEFESNPERVKFDWSGFWVRFFFGFLIGFLIGWRFVRSSTSQSTVLTAMIITGLFVGLAYGLYRPNFWGRP